MSSTAADSARGGRDFSVDALKGFAIACVVLGHVLLRNLVDPASNPIYLLLTAFEMPLFMFLSGYVLAGRVRAPRLRWWADRTARLMVVFVVWHFIFFATNNWQGWLSQPVATSAAGLLSYLGRTVAAPSTGLWYLPALAIASGVLALLIRFEKRPVLLAVAGAVVIEVLARSQQTVLPGADFGLSKILTFWPAFAAGYVWAAWGRKLNGAAGVAGLLTVAAYVPIAIYGTASVGQLGELLMRTVKTGLGWWGTLGAATALRWAEPVARAVRLDRLGQLTLGIYCSHWLYLRVEFGSSPLHVVGGFLFVLTAAGLTSLLIDRSAPLKAVLLGGWPKVSRRTPQRP